MKKVSMRKFSLLGLVLIGASAVTAAVLPKNDVKLDGAGVLEDSVGADGAQQTCKPASEGNECGYTVTIASPGIGDRGVGSRTSTGVNVSSSITNISGVKVNTITTDNSGDPAETNTTHNPF